jgi:hypothetical protein
VITVTFFQRVLPLFLLGALQVVEIPADLPALRGHRMAHRTDSSMASGRRLTVDKNKTT